MKTILFLLAFITNIAFVQSQSLTTFSELNGLVVDGTDNLSKLKISLLNDCKKRIKKAKVGKDGTFSFGKLGGNCCYSLQVEKPNYKTVTIGQICIPDETVKPLRPLLIVFTEGISENPALQPSRSGMIQEGEEWLNARKEAEIRRLNSTQDIIWNLVTIGEAQKKAETATNLNTKVYVTYPVFVPTRIIGKPRTRTIEIPTVYKTEQDTVKTTTGEVKIVERQVVETPATTKEIMIPSDYSVTMTNVLFEYGILTIKDRNGRTTKKKFLPASDLMKEDEYSETDKIRDWSVPLKIK